MHGLADWLSSVNSVSEAGKHGWAFLLIVLCAWASQCLAWLGRRAWDGFAPQRRSIWCI